MRARRRRPRRSASTVRAAVDRLGDDTVEHGIGGPLAQVALGRVAEVAPRREPQERQPDDDGERDLPAGDERGDDGDRQVTAATKIDGTPKRMTCESASTSLVVRETRSPVPARSTVDSGSSTTRPMNCSRSSAKTVSPMTNDARRANHVTTVCTTTAPAIQRARVLTTSSERPLLISKSTSRPMTRGATSAATAATVCRPMTRSRLAAVPAQQAARVGPDRRGVGDGQGGAGGRGRWERHQSSSPRRRRCAGSRDRGMSCWWVPGVATALPSRRKTTSVGAVEDERARGHDDGGAPRPASVSRAAMRASVWASTALVGSTSTRVSASVSSARVSARRWRWPPENARPRSSTSLSRPPGRASSTSSPLATDSAARIVASSIAPGVELVAQRAGEEPGVGLQTTTIGAAGSASGASRRAVDPGGPRVVARSGRAGRPGRPSPRAGRHDDGEAAGLDADPAARLDERDAGPGRGVAGGVRVVALVGPHRRASG